MKAGDSKLLGQGEKREERINKEGSDSCRH